MLQKESLKKSFFWNTLGSALNSFNSLFFLIIVTRINGVNDAGIFTLCFATACMFYCISVYSGRTYQVTETDESITDNEYIINRIICSIVMIMISMMFAIIKGYNSYKLLILLLLTLFKASEAVSDVFHGILQKNEKLYVVGKSLFFRSLLNIILFLIIDLLTNSVIYSCFSLIISNLIILFIVDVKQSFKYKEKLIKINLKAVFKIFTFGFYTFSFMLISNYLINIPRYGMDLLNDESLQTIFGIIVMPATMIMLLCQFILQPVITKLKQFYFKNDRKHFLSIIYKLSLSIIIIGILCLIIGYFIGIPILNLLYGLELNNYLINLLIIIVGAVFYTLANIITNAMVIFRKTKVQFYIYLVVTVISYFICNTLIKYFDFNGATYTYLIMMFMLLLFNTINFIIFMNNNKNWKGNK